MGEIAEMMLDGTMCQCCGVFLNSGEEGDGFPVYCSGCEPEEEPVTQKKKVGSSEKRRRKKIRKILQDNFDTDVVEGFFSINKGWVDFLQSSLYERLKHFTKQVTFMPYKEPKDFEKIVKNYLTEYIVINSLE